MHFRVIFETDIFEIGGIREIDIGVGIVRRGMEGRRFGGFGISEFGDGARRCQSSGRHDLSVSHLSGLMSTPGENWLVR
jgi:hypothetical protein